MSHPVCEPEQGAEPSVGHTPAAPAASTTPAGSSYECVNQCASSLGAVALVESAIAGLGCVAVPVACPVFVTAVPATILGACDAACKELL